jgi:DNA modification methylase
MCGDSTDSDSVAKLMNGEKADMVVTDPPYNVNYGADTTHPSWSNNKRDRTIKNDKMSGDDFKIFMGDVANNIRLFCDGVIYCFGAQGKDGRIMFTVLDNLFHNSSTIIWVKDSLVLGRGKYHSKYEPCWFGWNKDGSTFTEDRTLTNVWECNRPKISELHPTMKPIELLEIPLKHNPKATSVLDLFLGSGSTMVAAHQLNRKCYGMELDEKYCQVIIDRMKKLDSEITVKINGNEYTQNP